VSVVWVSMRLRRGGGPAARVFAWLRRRWTRGRGRGL